jgi:hypothetical protein
VKLRRLHFTNVGTVTDFIQQERPERSEPGIDSPDYWRAYQTLPVEYFFKQWEGKFRSLEWVVNPYNIDDGMMLRYDEETDVSCPECGHRSHCSEGDSLMWFGLSVESSTNISRS